MSASRRNVAERDQAAAAYRDAVGMVKTMAPILDGDIIRNQEVPPFLQRFADAHNAECDAGRLRCCQHVTGSPQVLHAAVWAPGLLVCSRCAAAGGLHASLDEAGNWTCDICGEHKPGQISASVIRSDSYLIAFGSCRECGAAMRAAAGNGER